MHKIIFPWPPSVNGLYYQGRNHKQKFLSQAGKKFRKQIEAIYGTDREPIAKDTFLVIDLFPPDRRKRDIDNYSKAVLDNLVNCKFLRDDSYIQSMFISIERGPPKIKGGMVVIQTLDLEALWDTYHSYLPILSE